MYNHKPCSSFERAYVLDSLSDHISPSSSEVITNIQHFLATLGVTAETFTPFPLKVDKNNDNNSDGHTFNCRYAGRRPPLIVDYMSFTI